MSQDLSNVIPQLLAQGLLALRSRVVMARLVNRSYENEAREKGDTVDVPIPSAVSANDVVPAAYSQAVTDLNPTKAQIQLNNWKEAAFNLTDKEMREAAGGLLPMQASEAINALARAVNESVLSKYTGIYGFVGTAGTPPFGGSTPSFNDLIAARRILSEQFAPLSDRRMVLDPIAEAELLEVPGAQDASFRGDTGGIIEGQIGKKMGFDIYMDQQVPTHTAGTITTGLAAKTSTAQAIGLTDIVCTTAAATGACALLVGDIVSIAGDSQTYVLTAAATQAAAATDVTLSISPPLQVALTGDEAVTVKASHVVNLAFHRDAFALAVRPLMDDGLASGRILSATDPESGLALRLEVSREHKRTRWSYDILWGTAVIRAPLAVRLAG